MGHLQVSHNLSELKLFLTNQAGGAQQLQKFSVLPQLCKLPQHEMRGDLLHALKSQERVHQVHEILCFEGIRDTDGHPKVTEDHGNLPQGNALMVIISWNLTWVAQAAGSGEEELAKKLKGCLTFSP